MRASVLVGIALAVAAPAAAYNPGYIRYSDIAPTRVARDDVDAVMQVLRRAYEESVDRGVDDFFLARDLIERGVRNGKLHKYHPVKNIKKKPAGWTIDGVPDPVASAAPSSVPTGKSSREVRMWSMEDLD